MVQEGAIISGNEASGAVFYISTNVKTIAFTCNGTGYLQYGICDLTATLPTIITQGTGRGDYKASNNSGSITYSIPVNGFL